MQTRTFQLNQVASMAPTRATELQFDVQTKRSDLGRHFGTNQVLAGDKKRRKKKPLSRPTNSSDWLSSMEEVRGWSYFHWACINPGVNPPCGADCEWGLSEIDRKRGNAVSPLGDTELNEVATGGIHSLPLGALLSKLKLTTGTWPHCNDPELSSSFNGSHRTEMPAKRQE